MEGSKPLNACFTIISTRIEQGSINVQLHNVKVSLKPY